MANPSLRFKRGTQSAFNSVGLQTGEPAFITDDYNFYIGVDGNSETNKYFGSARYWTKETSAAGSGVNLVEGTSNGAHFITLASPASVGAAVTYYFPAANGVPTSVLSNDGNGNLSWASGSANPVFTGIATFNTTLVDINSDVDISGITTVSNTTDSTTKDNGSLVIEGGVGIEKSLNVGGNLKVSGISTFVGAVTFEGGTITLGDANTDNVVFNADVNSGILPNTDAAFDIGDASVSKRWRHASFSGVGTFATGAVIDAIQIGISATNEIDTTSGVLVLDSAAGQVQITDDLSVTGVSTFTGAIDANGGAEIDNIRIGIANNNTIDTSTGGLTLDSNSGTVTVEDDLAVSGSNTLSFNSNSFNISHSGGNANVFNGAGDLIFGADGNASIRLERVGVATLAKFTHNGSTELYYAGSKKLETIDSGVTITGTTFTNQLSVSGVSTFTGAIDANGGADISGGETVLSSATVSDLTSGRVVLAGTSGALEDSANLTFSGAGLIVGAGGANITGVSTFSTDLVVGGDIRVNGNDIKDGGGTAAITFDGSGNTTITGNLNVNGSTTQVNTTTLTIEDNLIELGKVDGNVPTSDLNKDIGMLLHYFDSAARLGAVYYDDSVSRVVLASRVEESSGVLTVDAGYYANVELQGLFVTDTAGSGEAVISYATIGGVTARHLQNITVDGGTF